MEKLGDALLAVPGVLSFHDLHVWAISSGKISLTVHVVYQADIAHDVVLGEVRKRLAHDFNITHTTVQCELTPCEQTDEDFHFPHAEHKHAEHTGHHHLAVVA